MTDTRTALRDAADWMDAQLIRRRDAIDAIVLTSLTGLNILMFGSPGVAKSRIAQLFSACLDGRFFQLALHELTQEEQLFGPIDVQAFQQGQWRRITAGTIVDADVAFLDEVDKAGPLVYNPLLGVMNERVYKHGTDVVDLPLLMVVGATNATLNDPTGAVFDRWGLRVWVDDVPDGDDFARLLNVAPVNLAGAPRVSIAGLWEARAEVADVKLPDVVVDAVQQLRHTLRAEGVEPSPRRWVQAMSVVRAAAWLDGRDEAVVEDLDPLRHVLWLTPEQRGKVTDRVLELAAPKRRELLTFQTLMDAVQAKFVDMDEAPRAEKIKVGVEVQAQLNDALPRLGEIRDTAGGATRDLAVDLTDRCRDLAAQTLVFMGAARTIEAARRATEVNQ